MLSRYKWRRTQTNGSDVMKVLRHCNFSTTQWIFSRPKRQDSLQNNGALNRKRQFSHFFIQSATKDGTLKNFGGDSWRVYIRQGPSSLAPLVLDHYNGLYEVLFLVLEPGRYSATVYLDHTLCDGYRDPPREWFNKGVDQGRYRAEKTNSTILGNINMDYINKPLGRQTHFSFSIQNASSPQEWPSVSPSCDVSCPFVWGGYGRWVRSHWKLYPSYPAGLARKSVPSRRLFNLMVLGDSNARRFITLAKQRPLCKTIFKKCSLTENWIYNSRKLYPEHKVQEGDGFDQDIILQQYREILSHRDMDRVDSVFLFNMGIHYSLVLNFTQYQNLVNSVIKLLTETTEGGRAPKYKAHIIWRGTTMIEREKLPNEPWPAMQLNIPLFRFHTNQRIQLFHAYATRAMCSAGIKVLDMYPLSAAYPKGTQDNVHYDFDAFEPAVERLEEYFAQNLRTPEERRLLAL